MKKKVIIISILFIACIVISMSLSFYKSKNMEQFFYVEGANGLQIQGGENIYTFSNAVGSDIIDKQIGIVDGDKKQKVFSIKGFSSDQRIVYHYDVIMSTYVLYIVQED